jgi:hypothetical protein
MLPRYQVAFWRIAIRCPQGKLPIGLWQSLGPVKEKSWDHHRLQRDISLDYMKTALSEAYAVYKLAKKSHNVENRLSFIETFPPDIRDRILRTEEARRKDRVASQNCDRQDTRRQRYLHTKG